MPIKSCVVMTTINDGTVLDSYCDQYFLDHYRETIKFFVIPDRKTPATLFQKVNELKRKGVEIACPTLAEQDQYLNKFTALSPLIPYNTDNRRNIGYLMGLEWGCDQLISIDDDNYCLDTSTYYQDHGLVTSDRVRASVLNSDSQWFNICEMLELNPNYPVYPRGYPYSKRHQENKTELVSEEVIIRMNAGLWLREPDLDACTWLSLPVRSTKQKSDSLVLGKNTWSPVNTQNTALHREVVPSFYYIRMGYPMMGLPIDRYGDILAGYFSQACIKALGHSVRVGTPVVDHIRNSHNYMKDLTNELGGMWIIEELTNWLTEAKVDGSNYLDAYTSLAHQLETQVEKFEGLIWTDATKGYFHQVAYAMQVWISACRQIGI
jgi:hypothetical protein